MSKRSAMTVSIALCTYQGERYLSAQLDSLLAQTRRPDEIVIYDDASQDGTWERLRAFAADVAASGIRIELVQNAQNVGYRANFQQALNKATGEIVFLCDQDDVWHPHKVARFCQAFEQRPDLLMLHSDARLVDGEGASLNADLFHALEVTREELTQVHAGNAFEVLLRRNIVTGATMAVRRSVFEREFVVPGGWIHDEWLAMLAASMGPVDCLEENTIDYRQHDGNQIGMRPRGFVERLTGGGVSRADFMAQMLARTQSLMDQSTLGTVHLREAASHLLQERLRHARMRAHLPEHILARAAAVLKEHASGRYGRFSNGIRSVLSDILKIRG